MNIIKLSASLAFFCIFLGYVTGCGNMKAKVKLNQYIVEGMQLYRQHCANCHQVKGTGLARLIPPLKSSDYLENMEHNELACQIRFGLYSEITVNGVSYNQQMPGIPELTPLEIAEIITYVKNTWSDDEGLYEVKQAEKALDTCIQGDEYLCLPSRLRCRDLLVSTPHSIALSLYRSQLYRSQSLFELREKDSERISSLSNLSYSTSFRASSIAIINCSLTLLIFSFSLPR